MVNNKRPWWGKGDLWLSKYWRTTFLEVKSAKSSVNCCDYIRKSSKPMNVQCTFNTFLLRSLSLHVTDPEMDYININTLPTIWCFLYFLCIGVLWVEWMPNLCELMGLSLVCSLEQVRTQILFPCFWNEHFKEQSIMLKKKTKQELSLPREGS